MFKPLGDTAGSFEVAMASWKERSEVTKALVTGGAGFIGSRLVKLLLREGYSVRVLDVSRGRLDGIREAALEFVGLTSDDLNGGMADRDLVDEATRGVDVVYHLALNWDGHSWAHRRSLADLWNVNIRGTLNLLEAAKAQGVQHFLYASSVAVYGKRASPVMDEEAIPRPELWRGGPGPAYAIMKLALERLCLLYHVEHGLPVTVFRIDVVFDDDEYLDLSQETIRAAVRGEPLKVERGEAGASIHVDDVATAFLMASRNRKAHGQVLNLSNPRALISDLEVCKLVIDAVRSESQIEFVESSLTGPVIGGVEKAERLLGWRPAKGKEDLERTITRMAQREARRTLE